MKIQDSIALVTGASGAIGRELVAQLLAGGAKKVYASARDTGPLGELAQAHMGRVELLTLDITRPEQVEAARVRCADINLLVNNAGVNRNQGLLAAASMEHAQAEIATNYLGTLTMCRAFAPQLTRGDMVVNIVSILAKATIPLMGSLCASKAALLRMTEGVRAELAPRGVQVMAVMPGPVDSRMTRDFAGPKNSPAEAAQAVLAGIERGDEEVYLGDMAAWINAGMAQDAKGIERELAKYLPA